MSTRMPVKDAVSAGGIVWRRDAAGGIEIVVCGRRSDQFWGLPKGTPDPDEDIEATARREVEEETGLRVTVGEKIGSIDYWFVADGVRFHKKVHHWLMEPVGGDVSAHDHEFDDVEWMPIVQAHRVLKYPNERKVVAMAANMLGVHL